MKKNIDLGLLIFRLTLGILMFMHGFHKVINGVDGIKGMLANIGMPEFLAYGVHSGETIAALMLIIGYRTRLAAVVFTAVMVVAFLMAHIEPLFALGKSGAWLHEGIALFLFGGLGLIFTGGGKYAVSSKHKWD
ncbi:DoxX family protein [Sphingobacterium arenae]|uniref:DoxX family protein n=1 Tax=Sphingobacterium arenae TaxID=1280598 RepID=A0ABR7Y5W9_9SPHI|nr:DoxX family protein [Sphingobacterium arenae]MBD1426707.1 DoxX family protein [Sphingobacterium arenae]